MELRTHPKMEWEGFSNWPPAWAGSYGAEDVFPGEEEGVLTGCRSPYLNRLARAILAQGKPREAEMLTRRMVLPPEWEAQKRLSFPKIPLVRRTRAPSVRIHRARWVPICVSLKVPSGEAAPSHGEAT